MDDAISREQAIKATWQDTGYTDPFNVMTAIRDRIKQLPPIQTEPHWIPVTERLPETYESVLVWSNGYICKDMIVCPYDDKIWYRCGKIEDDDYWMPLSCLPEPYKGVTE